MTPKKYQEQIKRLIKTKEIAVPSKMRQDEYYRALNYINDDEFTATITYLIDNYKFPQFPQIWDFNEAKKAACPTPETTLNYNKRDPNYCTEVRDIFKQLKIMDVIRAQEIPDEATRSQKYITDITYPFYAKMVERGLVFSHSTKKWIDKKNMIKSSKYFDPKKFGFPVREYA